MSILDGLAEEMLEAFKDDFKDGTLHVPGTQTSDGQGGWIPGSPVNHPCKVIVTDPNDFRRLALGIPATDRLILVLAASLSVVPLNGWTITAPDPDAGFADKTFLITGKKGDPAGVLYKLQAR
ncbi:MAG: hypothetical protein ACK4FB_08135 [Brevundimonas sp.]|uniref:hypothetical protein n=1 Tax=Brevundimonas sp. TaxID=1871086 RepID=UPI00391AD76A